MSESKGNLHAEPELSRREFLKRSAVGSASLLLAPERVLPAPRAQRIELQEGWKIISARDVLARDNEVSGPSFDASGWHAIRRMPATVLDALEGAGIYKDLYFGMNLTQKVPADLWQQDWWYRTSFEAPTAEVYFLIFNGINYRADIWLNGHLVADQRQVVGAYNSFEFAVSGYIKPGKSNILAIKVTPEQKLARINGLELGVCWETWLNWRYIGYRDHQRHVHVTFVPDRNAGVWGRVFLSATSKVSIRHPYVVTHLPLPAPSPARLTIYCDLRNGVDAPVSGTLHGEISRLGKPSLTFEQNLALKGNETREVMFAPEDYSQLSVHNPDLWWPYEWGEPALYELNLEFRIDAQISDSSISSFGIRTVTQHRDSDDYFPQVGSGGNFYLKVNGKDFLVRGAAYTPDLLFKNDPKRDQAIVQYAKDLGANMLRWEGKLAADDTVLDLADREGIGVLQGWMCCGQWEMWNEWDAEDHGVAVASLRARIRNLRHHASAFMWADGSDGRPPDSVRSKYHQVLGELHWQNAVVDTVSNFRKDARGHALWNGIHMLGPYSWRPPYYWFDERFPANQGACAEQGDSESVPPFESLKKFIPTEKLWPINECWYYHCGSNPGHNTLETIRRVIEKRYGPATSAEDFCKKAQLAHYENTRAQFEDYAANSWVTHKMTIYWMLNNHWPSFYGHLIDYYLKPGGAYFGAKKGLRPVSIVFDYYATGDRRTAHIYLVNQTLDAWRGLKATVRLYNLDATVKFSKEFADLSIGPLKRERVLSVPRIAGVSSTYFVRCQLFDSSGPPIVDNLYWQSWTDDDMGGPQNDNAMVLNEITWADLTALDTMPKVEAHISGNLIRTHDESHATITITNPSAHVAFFMRAEVTRGPDGEEVLPITYEDNYVTLFPGESRTLWARFSTADLEGRKAHLRLEGYNVNRRIATLD
jgi:exo-1,4-beta-D-glucosaminidase